MAILSNGNVGIATTLPTYTLDISGQGAVLALGSVAAANSGLLIQGYSNSGFIRTLASASTLYLGASNSNIVSINQTSVGIAVPVPTRTLDVSGSLRVGGTLAQFDVIPSGVSSEYANVTTNGYVNFYKASTTNKATSNLLTLFSADANQTNYFLSNRIGISTTVARWGFQSNAATSGIYSLDVSGQVFGRLPVFVVSTTTLDLSANYNAYANTYFYLTNSGFSNVTIPTASAVTAGGTFFQLKNSTTAYMSVIITGTVGITSPVTIAPSNAITFVVSPSNADRMLLF